MYPIGLPAFNARAAAPAEKASRYKGLMDSPDSQFESLERFERHGDLAIIAERRTFIKERSTGAATSNSVTLMNQGWRTHHSDTRRNLQVVDCATLMSTLEIRAMAGKGVPFQPLPAPTESVYS